VICGHDHWCTRSQSGVWAVCRRVDDGTGKHKVDKVGDSYWLYRVIEADLGATREAAPPSPIVVAKERAASETLHAVYTALLGHLTLTGKHRTVLRARGLTDTWIDRAQYRTLPSLGRAQIARRLVDQFGPAISERVPGFVVRRSQDGQSYWTVAGSAGLIIPVRDVVGRIVALLVRSDAVDHGRKYSYISSSRDGGPGPGAPVHVPVHDGAISGIPLAVEGILKADVVYQLSGRLTIGQPGVSAISSLLVVLKTLGLHDVELGYDTDHRTNPHVMRALARAVPMLNDAGHPVSLTLWDVHLGKGLDDLLHAGHQPQIINGDAVATYVQGAAAGLPKMGGQVAERAGGEPEMREPAQATGPRPTLDGPTAYARIEQAVCRYLRLPARCWQTFIALWVLHTYGYRNGVVFESPRLFISGFYQSGKTRVLEVLAVLCPEPIFSTLVTSAGLFRSITTVRPVLLIDETGSLFVPAKERSEKISDLLAFLNGGYRDGATVRRCIPPSQEVRPFPIFAPVAMVMLAGDRLPHTLASRGPILVMQRKRPADRLPRFRMRDALREFAELRAELAAWTHEHAGALRTASPAPLMENNDRIDEVTGPLLAAAEACGLDMPEVRKDLAACFEGRDEEGEELSILLLRDICTVFDLPPKPEKMLTVAIAEALCALEDRPWGTWWRSVLAEDNVEKKMGRRLAALLKLFRVLGVTSKNVVVGEVQGKGYERADFEEAWARYCPPVPPSLPRSEVANVQNVQNQAEQGPSHENQNVQEGSVDVSEIGRKTIQDKAVDVSDVSRAKEAKEPGIDGVGAVVRAFRDVLPVGTQEVTHQPLHQRLLELTGETTQAIWSLIASAIQAGVLVRVRPLVYRLGGLS
jgi:hypothetical protein